MTVEAILDRLQGLGVEVIPKPPSSIRLRYSRGPELPDEARPLIEALRGQKETALATLMRWDETREREKLEVAFDWADAEPRQRGIPWADAWEDRPPELGDAMNQALDAIDDAWEHQDPAALVAALEGFRRVVTAILNAYERAIQEGERVTA
jgi:hypothetical protein